MGYEYIDDTLVQSEPREDSDEPPSLEDDESVGLDQLAIHDLEEEVKGEGTENVPQYINNIVDYTTSLLIRLVR